MKVVKIEPIGKRNEDAFVYYADGHGALERVEVNVYPESPRGRELHRVRVEGDYIRLGIAARLLDVSVVEYCGLERGSHGFSSDAEWDAAIAAVSAGKRR